MKRRRKVSGRRTPTDWVYRSNAYASNDGAPWTYDQLGTYEHSVRSLTSGHPTAQALWLVDSSNHYHTISFVNATVMGAQNGAARPEGKRTKVLAVEGLLYLEPTTWAVGNLMAMGVRIAALEQDINTGLASVDPDMTMWANALQGPGRASASVYANDRQLTMYERRQFKAFTSNSEALMVMHIRARINWTLQAHHGLALWLEAESTSVNMRYQTWFRTLVQRP